MGIDRVSYHNRNREDSPFEIVTLQGFFNTRPRELLERAFRLDFWSLMYITEGEGVHSIDFIEYPYRAGDLIVISKNQVQAHHVNHTVRGYVININEPFFIERGNSRDMDILSFFEATYGQPLLHVDISKGTTSRELIDLIYSEYRRDDNSTDDLIRAMFASFTYSMRKENRESLRTFSAATYEHYHTYRELVELNYTKLKAVIDYESLMGLSKKSINAACRECAGISAKELIINRIILEVKRLLVQGKLKNYEISDALGFDEPANLAGFFKRYTGVSMRVFRQSMKMD